MANKAGREYSSPTASHGRSLVLRQGPVEPLPAARKAELGLRQQRSSKRLENAVSRSSSTTSRKRQTMLSFSIMKAAKDYLLRRNKIAVFNKDGDAIVSRSTRSLGNSVQDACGAIVADWTGRGAAAPSEVPGEHVAPAGPFPNRRQRHASAHVVPAAKQVVAIPVQLMATPTIVPARPQASATPSGNLGTVSVTSDPDGAEIFVDSVGHGYAPAILKLPPGKHSIQLVRQGYKDWTSNVDVRRARSLTSRRSLKSSRPSALLNQMQVGAQSLSES